MGGTERDFRSRGARGGMPFCGSAGGQPLGLLPGITTSPGAAAMKAFPGPNPNSLRAGVPLDPDGPGPLPEHKTEGDSLAVFQEYRGFILDGGPGHSGGHTRLSPARKEFLVEVDIMAGVTHMPSEAEIRGIMDTVSAGFADPDDGVDLTSKESVERL